MRLEVHHELEAVLGPDAIPYFTVTRTLHSAIWTQSDPETRHSEIQDAFV
jgi:hypothetical protein